MKNKKEYLQSEQDISLLTMLELMKQENPDMFPVFLQMVKYIGLELVKRENKDVSKLTKKKK